MMNSQPQVKHANLFTSTQNKFKNYKNTPSSIL